MAGLGFLIPGAPDAETLVAYQAAILERVRSFLLLRTGKEAEVAPEIVHRAQAAVNRLAALEKAHRFPFSQMADALGLDRFDRDALGLIVAPHLDPGLREDIRRFRRDPLRGHVDGALALALFTGKPEVALSVAARFRHDGVLHATGLVDFERPRLGHTPSHLEHEIVPTARLLGLLEGRVVIDPSLRDVATLVRADRGDVAGILAPAAQETLFRAARARGARVRIEGPEGVGKISVASAFAAAAGFGHLVVVDVPLLRLTGDLAGRLQKLEREARLLDSVLVLRQCHEAGDARSPLRALVERVGSTVIGTTIGEEQVLPAGAMTFAVRRPDRGLRQVAWSEELRRQGLALAADETAMLASELPLPRRGIARAVDFARASGQKTAAELEAQARLQLGGGLARLATRSRSRARLDDVILAEPVRQGVTSIITAYRNRPRLLAAMGDGAATLSKGIVALFNGSPGTGKTLSASVVANELELPMYRIEVSSIVDRYVGETEKNLTRLFEEAASDHAALLFDEADSLFARRVEVKGSNDRYANMQVNVLLNLIEDYEGLVILTTNLKGSLDPALVRRVAYKVEFELPQPDERDQLWRHHLSGFPLSEDVDIEEMATEYAVSGGEIKNAVTRAALQVGAGVPLDSAQLRAAVRGELAARGSVVAGH